MSVSRQRRMQETLLSNQQIDMNSPKLNNKWNVEKLLQTTIKSNQIANMPNNRYLSVSHFTRGSNCLDY
jgi:hypothetical protein